MIISRKIIRRACQSRTYDTCFDPALCSEYVTLSTLCDSYSTVNTESLSERGTQTPTYDAPDTVGIDINTDFHLDRFDQFELIKSAKLADLDKKAKLDYLEKLRKSIDADISDKIDKTDKID